MKLNYRVVKHKKYCEVFFEYDENYFIDSGLIYDNHVLHVESVNYLSDGKSSTSEDLRGQTIITTGRLDWDNPSLLVSSPYGDGEDFQIDIDWQLDLSEENTDEKFFMSKNNSVRLALKSNNYKESDQHDIEENLLSCESRKLIKYSPKSVYLLSDYIPFQVLSNEDLDISLVNKSKNEIYNIEYVKQNIVKESLDNVYRIDWDALENKGAIQIATLNGLKSEGENKSKIGYFIKLKSNFESIPDVVDLKNMVKIKSLSTDAYLDLEPEYYISKSDTVDNIYFNISTDFVEAFKFMEDTAFLDSKIIMVLQNNFNSLIEFAIHPCLYNIEVGEVLQLNVSNSDQIYVSDDIEIIHENKLKSVDNYKLIEYSNSYYKDIDFSTGINMVKRVSVYTIKPKSSIEIEKYDGLDREFIVDYINKEVNEITFNPMPEEQTRSLVNALSCDNLFIAGVGYTLASEPSFEDSEESNLLGFSALFYKNGLKKDNDDLPNGDKFLELYQTNFNNSFNENVIIEDNTVLGSTSLLNNRENTDNYKNGLTCIYDKNNPRFWFFDQDILNIDGFLRDKETNGFFDFVNSYRFNIGGNLPCKITNIIDVELLDNYKLCLICNFYSISHKKFKGVCYLNLLDNYTIVHIENLEIIYNTTFINPRFLISNETSIISYDNYLYFFNKNSLEINRIDLTNQSSNISTPENLPFKTYTINKPIFIDNLEFIFKGFILDNEYYYKHYYNLFITASFNSNLDLKNYMVNNVDKSVFSKCFLSLSFDDDNDLVNLEYVNRIFNNNNLDNCYYNKVVSFNDNNIIIQKINDSELFNDYNFLNKYKNQFISYQQVDVDDNTKALSTNDSVIITDNDGNIITVN